LLRSSQINFWFWNNLTQKKQNRRYLFGVVGIPVTALATFAQKAGIRYIGLRNEQAAGYAAGAAGYLTGVPGALLTVSGPGAVHGLAGLSNGLANSWPIVMVSGSAPTEEVRFLFFSSFAGSGFDPGYEGFLLGVSDQETVHRLT
jgi:thiamine pyrophosphate-dependent acetolactate synthase large subunit-like protein